MQYNSTVINSDIQDMNLTNVPKVDNSLPQTQEGSISNDRVVKQFTTKENQEDELVIHGDI
jgi:hypothetical protein